MIRARVIYPEQKPAWSSLPSAVRTAIAAQLGGTVTTAVPTYGGYGPTPTFRVSVSGGGRAFVKCAGPESSEFVASSLAIEVRVYTECVEALKGWSPSYLGQVELDGWRALLLEDLGRSPASPWTPHQVSAVAGLLAGWHRRTKNSDLPGFLPAPTAWLPPDAGPYPALFRRHLSESAEGLGVGAATAQRWLDRVIPTLTESSRHLLRTSSPPALLHGDLRSDNMRLIGSRLTLFDWPSARRGPVEYDLAFFAQSVASENGPEPEQVLDAYVRQSPIDEATMDAAVCLAARFFLSRGWSPAISGLPRLRPFQRSQADVSLRWALRRLHLDLPAWAPALLQGIGPRSPAETTRPD